MASYRTAMEVKISNVASMGEELGLLYSELWQQVAWLNNKWEQYTEIFGTNEERIKLVNRAAPSFFRVVQDSLWNDVLLHVARLMDPPKSVGRPNLSIRRLPSLIAADHVRIEVENLIEKASIACEFCKDWRNRHIAHRDLELAIKAGATPLANASRAYVKEAIETIGAVLNSVSLYYFGSTTWFEVNDHDPLSLLYLLDDGMRFQEARKARRKAGVALPEDDERTKL